MNGAHPAYAPENIVDRPQIVYFSNVSGNTHRFIERLGLPAARIAVRSGDPDPVVTGPYVLVTPTYGGASATPGKPEGHVPRQVVTFLNQRHNRQWCRGVIAAGNTNFGAEFAVAGDIIAAKLGVPLLYRFELMGTQEDVERVREGLEQFWLHQR